MEYNAIQSVRVCAYVGMGNGSGSGGGGNGSGSFSGVRKLVYLYGLGAQAHKNHYIHSVCAP